MNALLWIIQILAGAAFLMSGVMKATQPKEKLAGQMKWVNDYSAATVRNIGIAELLGGLGLILPWALYILPALTPIAGLCLVALMVGAVNYHIKKKDNMMMPSLVLGVLALLVGIGRFL